MQRALNRILVLTAYLALLSCITTYTGNAPTEGGSSDEVFSQRVRKHEKAMALLGEAQTQIKSGNSREAIISLVKARKLNPWHDDIKDLYVVAVKIYVKVTQRMISKSVDCSLINQRLTFINSVSPDRLSIFENTISRCGFRSNRRVELANIERDLKVPQFQQEMEKFIVKGLEGELNLIIKRNNYVPNRELLIAGIRYLQSNTFTVKDVNVNPNTTNSDDITLLVKVEERFTGPDKYDYCKQLRRLLEVKNTGHSLWCRGLSDHKKNISIPRSWYRSLDKFFPVPRKIVHRLSIHYKDGTKEEHFLTMNLSKEKQKRLPIESAKCRPHMLFGYVSDRCVFFKKMRITEDRLKKMKSVSIRLDPEKTYLANIK